MDAKEYQRQYYLKHKEERRQKVTCPECKREVCKEYLIKHKSKPICQKWKKIFNLDLKKKLI